MYSFRSPYRIPSASTSRAGHHGIVLPPSVYHESVGRPELWELPNEQSFRVDVPRLLKARRRTKAVLTSAGPSCGGLPRNRRMVARFRSSTSWLDCKRTCTVYGTKSVKRIDAGAEFPSSTCVAQPSPQIASCGIKPNSGSVPVEFTQVNRTTPYAAAV